MLVTNIKNDVSEIYEKQGYEILEVPIEFYRRFDMDIQAALMNIAGISISHVTKFIPYPSLTQCYIQDRNPFTSNIIAIGMKDSLLIQDFFIPKAVPKEIYSRPIFLHLDASLTGDRTGLGAVAVMGYKYQNEYDLEEGRVLPTKKLAFRHVFSLGIQCPQGSEISFQKTRDFMYYLKYTLGWNIKGISTDGFQSADTRQQLISMGFEDTKLISLDRSPDGYLVFKASLNEKRIAMLDIPELETEIIRLERDNMTGKVDHPPDGSKDISDGLTGALYNATLHEKELMLYVSEHASIIGESNETVSSISGDILSAMVPQKYTNSVEAIIDTNSESLGNVPKVLRSIKEEHPEMSLHEAVKEYLAEQDDTEEKTASPVKKLEPSKPSDEEIRRRFAALKNGSSASNDVYEKVLEAQDEIDGFIL